MKKEIKEALNSVGVLRIRMDDGNLVEAVLVDDLPKLFNILNDENFIERQMQTHGGYIG